MPTRHVRSMLCTEVEQDLLTAIHGVFGNYKLTALEQLQLINKVSFEFIGGVLKYAIRRERHGDENKPGDIE